MKSRRFVLFALMALTLTLGCRSAPQLRAERPTADAPGAARVMLTEIDVVEVRFEQALLLAGSPVAIEPIVLRVGSR